MHAKCHTKALFTLSAALTRLNCATGIKRLLKPFAARQHLHNMGLIFAKQPRMVMPHCKKEACASVGGSRLITCILLRQDGFLPCYLVPVPESFNGFKNLFHQCCRLKSFISKSAVRKPELQTAMQQTFLQMLCQKRRLPNCPDCKLPVNKNLLSGCMTA